MQDILEVRKDGTKCYDIVYSTDLMDLQKRLQSAPFAGKRALIVTDSNVAPLYANSIADLFPTQARPAVYTIPAGESNKNLDQIRGILRFLIEGGYDRHSYLIALGGGVVGDMTGFAAAIFMRGIPFVQIPTTLLAQADSSIGGKTGVDLDGYKNMVGAFHMPSLVFADVAFLKSLSGREFASGFAEVMKHGLIKDEAYYVWLIEHTDEILARDPDTLHRMLLRSNEIKAEVVERDPQEKGERMLLNFGHTIGHAVEKYKKFTLTHGECVALGCVAASFISWKKGLLSMEEYYEIRDMFVPFGLPITADEIDEQAVLTLTKSDKKAVNGHPSFVLLKGVGNAFVDTAVTDEEILAAIREISYTEEDEKA
jgi:3-dehydroquinate synthase